MRRFMFQAFMTCATMTLPRDMRDGFMDALDLGLTAIETKRQEGTE